MAIIRVGFASNSAGGAFGANSCSVSYSATTGNTLLLGVSTAGGTDTTVSDGVNTWTRDKTQTITGGGRISIYRATNITGGALTITASITSGSMNFALMVVEYSGLDPTPLDGSAAAANNTNSISSGTIATTNANDLIFSAAENNTQTITAGSGTTEVTNRGQGGLFVDTTIGIVGEQIVSATGSYSGDYTIPTSAQWGCIAVAYKGPAGGGGLKANPLFGGGGAANPLQGFLS